MSEEVEPEDFTEEMRDRIFCPRCATPLTRSPTIKNISSSSQVAHYKHRKKQLYPESENCEWRVFTKPGLSFTNEQEAQKAIDNQDLIVVSGWREEPPSSDTDKNAQGDFSPGAVEDQKGPETSLPINRHTGENINVPSRITTVMALCKNFPLNLAKGFYFPNSQYPMLLSDQLYPLQHIGEELPKKETLFFGKIKDYTKLTHRDMIELTAGIYTFRVYTYPRHNERKQLDATSIGRYLLFSATPYWENPNNIASVKIDHWGAFSLLPKKYDSYAKKIEKRTSPPQ